MALLAVDIDDVLIPFFSSLADWHNKRLGTNYKVDSLRDFNLSSGWGIDEEYWIAQCNLFHSTGGSASIDIDPEAGSSLARLAEDHEIVLVTSRPVFHHQHTSGWMKRNLSNVTDRLIMCDSYTADGGTAHMNKGDIAKDLGADYLIDDAVHYIEKANQSGVKGILFGNYSWNRAGHDKFLHARTWADVEAIIEADNL